MKATVKNFIDPISVATTAIAVFKIIDDSEVVPKVRNWFFDWRRKRLDEKKIDSAEIINVLLFIGQNGDRYSLTIKGLNGFWKAGYHNEAKGWLVDDSSKQVSVVADSENLVKIKLRDYLNDNGYMDFVGISN